jgi:hypothetical protein
MVYRIVKDEFKNQLKNITILSDFSIQGLTQDEINLLSNYYTDTEK